mgnify:CR=1 FL=1
MPCLSPDGTRIAFTYQGNLWTCDSDGGVATRLTANEALDGSPKWSPDGKWIAFNSDREGAIQIFMIPSVGGAARQLTAYSGGVALHDWFPDSNSLLVITNRGEMRHSVYRMDIGTGALTRLYNDRIVPDSPRLSPDGKRFVFARGEGFDTLRRNYKGSANMDLYVATVDGSQPTRLLYRDANRMNDMWPTWVDGGQSVVFAHDSGGVTTFNKIGLNSGSVQPLFKASDMAFYAASSSATNRVVYESGFDLYSFKVGEQPKKLAIYCRSDSKGATAATATIASLGVQEFKISPDGTVSDAWTGLTRTADIAFGPDGKLYAAELSTDNTERFPFVSPHTGRIVRQSGPDSMDVIAEGLDFPVGLGFDAGGALYVTGPANGALPEDGANVGAGWLARVEMDGNGVDAAAATPTCAPMATPSA